MSFIDWFQIFTFLFLVILISPLMGKYMALVLDGKQTLITPLLSWLENLCYRLVNTDPTKEMNWKEYLKSLLLFNFTGIVLLFLILILQKFLPLNPQNLPNVPWDLAINIAISFTTNTDWQAYSGETTLSNFTQMVGLTTQCFLSAATGIAAMLVLIRGFVRRLSDQLGNFWVDLTRTVVYILLPLSIPLAFMLVSQGSVQTLHSAIEATTLENHKQIIPVGPVASQVAIKQLGTNGGGFYETNSAHPFENPTPISNFIEHLAIVLIPASLFYTFGYLINAPKQGATLFYVAMIFWIVTIILSAFASMSENPALNLPMNMEGIETRFHISNSSFWTMSTTETSNGSKNASISSLAPLTGGLAIFNILLEEPIMGGAGTGLCSMLKYVILVVFTAGLMIGRMPEYLGKKIEKTEIQWAIFAIFFPSFLTLLGSAISYSLPIAVSSISEYGPHGYSEILYAFASTANNNGSAFAGFHANTYYYNLVLGLTALLGRLSIIVPAIAIGGSLANKQYFKPAQESLKTDNSVFGVLLICFIFILSALTFLPALALGPILEHFLMIRGDVF